jgi:hypothetical protein
MATEISSWADLAGIADNLAGDYILTTDLDQNSTGYDTYASSTANSGEGWEPLGNTSDGFSGTFDGDGHTISDLYIDRDSIYVGLFSYADSGSEISNVGVLSCDITGFYYVGAVVGESEGSISKCYSTGSVKGNDVAGGLVGLNDGSGTISNCYSKASVLSAGLGYAGGLVGINTGSISKCYSTGSVEGNEEAGGLVANNSYTVSDSFWDTETSGQDSSDGGTGKTTSEMKDIDTYTDTATTGLTNPWSMKRGLSIGSTSPLPIFYPSTWVIVDNDYPYLNI